MSYIGRAEAVGSFYGDVSVGYLLMGEAEARSTLRSKMRRITDFSDQSAIDDWMEENQQYIWLQVSDLKHSNALPSGQSQSQFNTLAEANPYSDDIKSDPRNTTGKNNRQLYGPYNGTSSGGSGGIDPLDPDLKSGAVWTPLDTTAIAFNIYDAVVKGFLPARRPGRGGYIKKHPDRKSTIRVLDHQGQPIFATTDFVLERINRPKKERLNTQVTFDQLIAMFGTERMKLYSFQGKLLDCKTFDWMRQWDMAWEEVLRGERLAENIHRAYILNKAKIFGGYMVSCQITEDATIEPVVPFSFTLLVTDDEPLPNLSLITAKDEALLAEKFEGTEEEFQAELAALRVNLSGGIYDYSQSLDTKDPAASKQSNPDAD